MANLPRCTDQSCSAATPRGASLRCPYSKQTPSAPNPKRVDFFYKRPLRTWRLRPCAHLTTPPDTQGTGPSHAFKISSKVL